mmetsp:Transcript_9186/g.23575  ORF Transcript_9186/g.23575 Transcript_9186/m.23575 type:complete len:251 (-) Transcript_9186:97-849(-)
MATAAEKPFADSDGEPYCPTTFVTGGQTGADSIALRVHDATNIPVQGNMPKGFKRSDGDGKKVAARYGLKESGGGYSTRDKENATMSSACIGFLVTQPMTGKGTMQTVNCFTNGKYEFVVIQKPADADHLVIPPRSPKARPVIVFWNVRAESVEMMAAALAQWFNKFRPPHVMISGSTHEVWPASEEYGTQVVLRALSLKGHQPLGTGADYGDHTEGGVDAAPRRPPMTVDGVAVAGAAAQPLPTAAAPP